MATRFRLPASGAPSVSPAQQTYSHTQTSRRIMPTAAVGDATALATVAYTPDASDHLAAGDALHAQFVSDPMGAGNVFTSGDTLKFAVQGSEVRVSNNQALQVWVGIYSQDGTTLQATIRSKVSEGTEFAVTEVNRFLSTTLSGSYTTVMGDRLVVEFSVEGTPTAAGSVQGHNCSLRFGSDGAGGDLPENDTEAGTTLNPWIEFLTTIDFNLVAIVPVIQSHNRRRNLL